MEYWLYFKKKLQMNIKHFWKPVFWLALICYGLFLPAENIPNKSFLSIPHFDKLVHFGMFFIFCLLLFKPYKKINLKHYFSAPLTALFLGAVLESIQRIITISRSSDIYDFLANASGIVAATLFFTFFVSNRKWEKLF